MLGVFRAVGPVFLTSVPLYAPTVAILAYAYLHFSPWTSLLFFIPALAAQRLFGMYQQQRRLAEDLKRANMSFAEALVATLEKSDQYTAGHSKAVAIYARDIAERMGLSAGCSGTDIPLRSCSRHRQDRASGEPASQGWSVDARGATTDAGASGDW